MVKYYIICYSPDLTKIWIQVESIRGRPLTPQELLAAVALRLGPGNVAGYMVMLRNIKFKRALFFS